MGYVFSVNMSITYKGVVNMKFRKIAAVAAAAVITTSMATAVSAADTDQKVLHGYTTTSSSYVPYYYVTSNPYYYGYNYNYGYNYGYYDPYYGYTYYGYGDPYYYGYNYNYYGYYDPYYYGYSYYDPYYYGFNGLTYSPYYYSDVNYYGYMGFKSKSEVARDNKKEISKGTPYITGAKSYNGWKDLTKYAKEAKKGQNLYITLNGAKEIPADILSAIKGKDVLLTFSLDNGAYWTINGKDVKNAKAINPTVEYNIDYIPSGLKAKASKGSISAYQLGITDGFAELGTTASITVKISKSRADNVAYIYRFNKDTGGLTPVYKAVVRDNGTLTFDITAGGPYYIVLK